MTSPATLKMCELRYMLIAQFLARKLHDTEGIKPVQFIRHENKFERKQ